MQPGHLLVVMSYSQYPQKSHGELSQIALFRITESVLSLLIVALGRIASSISVAAAY